MKGESIRGLRSEENRRKRTCFCGSQTQGGLPRTKNQWILHPSAGLVPPLNQTLSAGTFEFFALSLGDNEQRLPPTPCCHSLYPPGRRLYLRRSVTPPTSSNSADPADPALPLRRRAVTLLRILITDALDPSTYIIPLHGKVHIIVLIVNLYYSLNGLVCDY
ncbi:hypothetical protein KSP40_PGU018150 [Platanthera guangdongensis]|uniref:Uncharacterized protein n=1 Tax=Platanthera guangdongensis TaxID=2320717 RepID=A0ABR2MCV1_9ASPA